MEIKEGQPGDIISEAQGILKATFEEVIPVEFRNPDKRVRALSVIDSVPAIEAGPLTDLMPNIDYQVIGSEYLVEQSMDFSPEVPEEVFQSGSLLQYQGGEVDLLIMRGVTSGEGFGEGKSNKDIRDRAHFNKARQVVADNGSIIITADTAPGLQRVLDFLTRPAEGARFVSDKGIEKMNKPTGLNNPLVPESSIAVIKKLPN